MKLIYNGREYADKITANAGNIELKHAMVGETLTIDTMSVPVIAEDKIERLITSDQDDMDFLLDSNGEILCSTEAEPIPEFTPEGVGEFYFNDNLVCKHYLKEIRQISLYEWKMLFYSAIAKLDETNHMGGFYNGQKASNVLADILSDIPYTVDPEIASIQVFGLLYVSTRRNNLQKLLMVLGAHVFANPDGSLHITTLSAGIKGTFDVDRVFTGGNVINRTPAEGVQVTEHTFMPVQDEVVLYDDATLEEQKIIFSEPAHDLKIEGGAIAESDVNYAIFQGYGAVKITGKKFLHIQRIVSYGDTTSPGAVVKKVSDNTLISAINAAAVAKRVFDFLSVKQTIRQDVIFGTERPGDRVNVIHPHTREMVPAVIAQMAISIGLSQLRARADFLVDYMPPTIDPGYTSHTTYTANGSFTVPAGVAKIRAVICGGGQAGMGGEYGAKGTRNSGGEGGRGGEAGKGGRIFIIEMNVTPGQVIPATIGSGGSGSRAVYGLPGDEGTPSIFGPYSSEYGKHYPQGYYEPMGNTTIGGDGLPGIAGGRGSSLDRVGDTVRGYETPPVDYYPGPNGQTVMQQGVTALGGGGGGAAVGANGGAGQSGLVSGYGDGYIPTQGGGGNGATSTINGGNGQWPGRGGGGGNGGGGGGQGHGYEFGNDGGEGGQGSWGGRGASGIIVIYY